MGGTRVRQPQRHISDLAFDLPLPVDAISLTSFSERCAPLCIAGSLHLPHYIFHLDLAPCAVEQHRRRMVVDVGTLEDPEVTVHIVKAWVWWWSALIS